MDSLVSSLGISTWSPPRFLAYLKELRLGSVLIWRLLERERWAPSLLLLVSALRLLLEALVGITWLAALWLLLRFHSCRVDLGRWVAPYIQQYGRISIVKGGLVELLNRFSVLLCGLLRSCLMLTRVGIQNLLRYRWYWEVYDDRLQFMAVPDVFRLDDAWRMSLMPGWFGLGRRRLPLLVRIGSQ